MSLDQGEQFSSALKAFLAPGPRGRLRFRRRSSCEDLSSVSLHIVLRFVLLAAPALRSGTIRGWDLTS